MSLPPRASASAAQSAPTGQSYGVPLTVLTSLFFMWGFLTCLNDILIPHLKAIFELSYTQSMLIQFCFFAAYFVVSLPSGRIVRALGYKRGIVVGLLVAAMGCLAFFPAAALQSYPLFLLALFVLASGITVLQVAANPYVTILGKPQTASSRLTLTQAFNSLGTTVAPLFGSLLILGLAVKSGAELAALPPAELLAYRELQASSVQLPYVGLAIALVVLAVFISFSRLPKVDGSSAEVAGTDAGAEDRASAWRYPHLVLGALAIFVYVGGEVSIGSFLVNFFGLPEVGGLKEEAAGKMVAFYWGGAMVGRFIGAVVMRYLSPGKVLGFCALVAAALVCAAMLLRGDVAMWTILAVGLFNSIMFPTIFALALRGLGRHTEQGSGILCMAIVGGALIPLLQGFIADHIGLQRAFFIPLLCYLYVAYYGWRGCRPVRARPAA